MPRITEECVARIKDSADIVDLVGRYIQLRRSGSSWTACCPFHNEKTPSFHVNPARQTFKCFGCGVGGDAVKFLMLFENLDYPMALRRIADMNGVAVTEEEENPEVARRRRLRSRVIEANTLAAEYYHRMLCRSRDAAHAREYLNKRGYNIDSAKAWQMGWAPPAAQEFRNLTRDRGFDERLLTDAYLVTRNSSGAYPVFRDRLMFPIHNVRGEIVGFSGRVLDAEKDPRKYVNTAETPAFRKGSVLFGLHKATGPIGKAGRTVVVCEGQLDVIACHEKADVRNAVAGLGTAFTEEHAALLRKYADKAILCYDGDSAGIKASEKTFRKLAQTGMDVYMATLPPGEDPDSLIESAGSQALREAIDKARPYLEARISCELAAGHGNSADKAALIARVADLAAEISGSGRRDVAVVDAATRLNAGLDDMRTAVTEVLRARKQAPRMPQPEYTDDDGESEMSPVPVRIIPVRLHNTVRGLLMLAARNEEAQQMLVDRIEELQEPIRNLSGGEILQRMLEILPVPGNSESWAVFLRALPPEQAATLRDIDNELLPMNDVAVHIDRACARAAHDSITVRIDMLRSRIRSADVPDAEKTSILTEISTLQKLLNS